MTRCSFCEAASATLDRDAAEGIDRDLFAGADRRCTCPAPREVHDAGTERAAIAAGLASMGYVAVERVGACGHRVTALAHATRDTCRTCWRTVALLPVAIETARAA